MRIFENPWVLGGTSFLAGGATFWAVGSNTRRSRKAAKVSGEQLEAMASLQGHSEEDIQKEMERLRKAKEAKKKKAS